MRIFKPLIAIIFISFFIATGCKKDPGSNDSTNSNELKSSKSASLSAEFKAKLAGFQSTLSSADRTRINQITSHILAKHEYTDLAHNMMNVAASPCTTTPFTVWISGQLSDWNGDSFYYADATAMLDLPSYDALVFENNSANQRFGKNGEYSQKLTKTFKDLKRFWNFQTDNIVLAAMHGGMLRDRAKMIRTYIAAFGLDQADAEYYADYVLFFLQVFPEYRNGDHPIFTLNAFSSDAFPYPPFGINGVIPAKIIMGDGIMEAFTALGYDDVAPQAILAHEFGHQIQSQLNLFGPNTSEGTRRTELMADAYSAYYLSHARGASMQWKRVKQFLQVFFNIGDCSFTSSGHHGTPAQRMAAAEWGYSIANNAQKQGHILTAQQFDALFEVQLPVIVTVSAPAP